jgi:hypothetical protein
MTGLRGVLFALFTSLLQATSTLPPRVACRDVAVTATLLREVVVPNWTTITKADLLRRWPGLQVSRSTPEWPASLIGNVDNLYCKETFSVQENGGLSDMSLFFSGTRDQVLEAARNLSAALRFPLSDADKKKLERDGVVLLRQMDRVPPVGLDVQVIGNLDGNAADWGVRLTVLTFR